MHADAPEEAALGVGDGVEPGRPEIAGATEGEIVVVLAFFAADVGVVTDGDGREIGKGGTMDEILGGAGEVGGEGGDGGEGGGGAGGFQEDGDDEGDFPVLGAVREGRGLRGVGDEAEAAELAAGGLGGEG